MTSLIVYPLVLAAFGQIEFERHEIDAAYPGGYQVAVADINGDGRPDVLALSTEANRVDWYENPSWRQSPIARTPKNIDLAPRDFDGDGRPEIALASGFYFSESNRGGEIAWLRRPAEAGQLWPAHRIATDPVVHRLRWGDVDGDGRAELIHASLFGPGSNGPREPKPAHLWAFRVPSDPAEQAWKPWKIDEALTVLHGIYVGDVDEDGRDEILTASFEGIWRFDCEGCGTEARWHKTFIAAGAPPVGPEAGAARGTSEIAPGRSGATRSGTAPGMKEWGSVSFLAAIEPWHGHQVVVYRPTETGRWERVVVDDTLREGHVLVVADFDGDGSDEIIAGWRGGGGGLALYQQDGKGGVAKTVLDRTVAAEGAVATDLNSDGRLDLVAIGGRTKSLVWYENCGNAPRHRSGVGAAR